jgi:hypothetical protein
VAEETSMVARIVAKLSGPAAVDANFLFDLENVRYRTPLNLTKDLRFFRAIPYLAAGTQTLSAAAISEFGTSVVRLTRCNPSFFPAVAWKTT